MPSYPTSLTLLRLWHNEAVYEDDKSGTRLFVSWRVARTDGGMPVIFIDRIKSATKKGRTWFLAPQGRTWGRVDKALHQDIKKACIGIRALIRTCAYWEIVNG